jgi:hypothetical protein
MMTKANKAPRTPVIIVIASSVEMPMVRTDPVDEVVGVMDGNIVGRTKRTNKTAAKTNIAPINATAFPIASANATILFGVQDNRVHPPKRSTPTHPPRDEAEQNPDTSSLLGTPFNLEAMNSQQKKAGVVWRIPHIS